MQLTKPINKHPQMQPFKPSRTHLEPFSFEDRDKHLVKKKEEFIKKVFEEEKKQREFHARPPPSYILKVHNGSAMSIKSDVRSVFIISSGEMRIFVLEKRRTRL